MTSSSKWEYDVFVSFKSGKPVDTFTSDLFKRLDQVGIRYFRDDNRERAREDFKGKRDKALEQVRFALVVFCESYVDVQVELRKRKNDPKLVAIPICYLTDRVVASRKLAGALGKKDEEISGYDLQAGNDDELKKLIDKIVERLVNQILSQRTEKIFGPFGGKDEISWRCDKIDMIYVVYNGDCIKSIASKAEHDTSNEQQKDSHCEVKFENEESITSFAGYFDNANQRITGLTFRTSKRMLGPFGKTDGEYFYVPSKGGKVVEFFGAGNGFLTSIGARVTLDPKPVDPFIVQRVGLIGKEDGYKWDDGHLHVNVRKIIGKYDSGSETIRSIEFEYEDTDRKVRPSETHGQMHGNNFTTEPIKMGTNEHLTAISAVCEGGYIKSLDFLIGQKRIKTISVDEKNKENEENKEKKATSLTAARSDQKKIDTISIPNGKIVGFYGWSEIEGDLQGIGAYFKEEPIQRGVRWTEREFWTDREFFGVRKIYLWLDKNGSTPIRGIRFVYDDGSEKGETVHHGDITKRGLCDEKKYELDYPREYLTSISGCTQKDDTIKSLTFHSNRRNQPHKSCAEVEGRYFWYPSIGSRITGFYGRFDNNSALQSIGVYAEAIPHTYPLKTIGPFGGTGHGVKWDDGVHTDVRAFRVSSDNHGIRSIRFMYDDNGSLVKGCQHGGGNAPAPKWIWLDFPNERLSLITVRKSGNAKDAVISHLQITTTFHPYRPFGPNRSGKPNIMQGGDCIKFKLDGHKMVGFLGRAGSYLNAIGARFEPN